MKTNMVSNFIRRVREFSTNLTREEIDKVIETHLKVNHYPATLRHRYINQRNIPTRPLTHPTTPTTTPAVYKPMVFVDQLTSRLRKTLRDDFPQVTLATRNERTVKAVFSNTKDAIPKEMRSKVIYRIPCRDCKSSYVGLTSNFLKTRMSGHRSDVTKLDTLTDEADQQELAVYELERLKEKTALITHCMEQQHRFNLEEVKIVDQHRRVRALPILEVCHIVNTEMTVNKRSDTDKLSSIYAGVLHTLKNCNLLHNTQTQQPSTNVNSNPQ